MEHLPPDLLISLIQWLIASAGAIIVSLTGLIFMGGKYLAGKIVTEVDALREALVEVKDEAREGFNKVSDALNIHANDLSGRIGCTDARVLVLEHTAEELTKDVDNIYPRLTIIEKNHASLAASVEKIVYPKETK